MTNAEFVAGLRALADWYEARPDAQLPHDPQISVCPDDTKEQARIWARTLGTFDKDVDDALLRLIKKFGPIELRVLFFRGGVCERRVVGTKKIKEMVPDPNAPKITTEVPDPAAPMVEIEREEEVVEWDCPPLLAEEEAAA